MQPLQTEATIGKLISVLWRTHPLLLASLAIGALGCQTDTGPVPPEAVVEEFIDRMRRVHGAPEEGRAAMELMSKSARENLAERAQRATAASGTSIAPEEMLVPSRFALQFPAHHFASSVQGPWATVSVYADAQGSRVEEIRCVMEEGGWKVIFELPPLPPIQKREAEN